MKTLIEFFQPWYIRLCVCIAAGMLWIAGYNLVPWSTMDGTTWAAWIQAVGSIAAIFVAIVVMNTQHSRDRRYERVKALEREINFSHTVEKFAYRLAISQQGLATAAKAKQLHTPAMTYQVSAFAALSRVGDAIPSWEAGEVVASHLLRLLQNCHVTAAMVDTAVKEPPQDVEFFAETIESWAKDVNAIAAELNRHRIAKFMQMSRLLR